MKSVKLIAPLITICLLFVPLAWSQGGNVEQQINALADQFTQAFGKADTGFMEKYFADDFTGIHSDGKLSTKAQEIDNVKSGTLKWASVDLHERKIRVYRETAVVVGLASSTGTVGGKPYSGDFRTTQIWVKHKGNWKVVAFQSTRVAPASQ
jgi:ketosteroid isomerase-like protein